MAKMGFLVLAFLTAFAANTMASPTMRRNTTAISCSSLIKPYQIIRYTSPNYMDSPGWDTKTGVVEASATYSNSEQVQNQLSLVRFPTVASGTCQVVFQRPLSDPNFNDPFVYVNNFNQDSLEVHLTENSLGVGPLFHNVVEGEQNSAFATFSTRPKGRTVLATVPCSYLNGEFVVKTASIYNKYSSDVAWVNSMGGDGKGIADSNGLLVLYDCQ